MVSRKCGAQVSSASRKATYSPRARLSPALRAALKDPTVVQVLAEWTPPAVPMLVEGLARLRESQPDLSVSIVEDTSDRLLNLLDQGRLDVVICRTSVSRRPAAYVSRARQQEQLVLVANPQHPQVGQAALTLQDLAASRWVVFPVNMPMRLTLEREFREAGLSFPLYPIETSSTFTTLTLLLQDRGLVAVMPWDSAKIALEHGMLAQLPLALNSRSEPYEVVTRKDVELSVPAQKLIEALGV